MVNGKIIKVCGMREAENIQEIESLQDIDMLGLSFRLICLSTPTVSVFL